MIRAVSLSVVSFALLASCSSNQDASAADGPPPSVITPVTSSSTAPPSIAGPPESPQATTIPRATTTSAPTSPPIVTATTGAPPTAVPATATSPPPVTVPLEQLSLALEPVAGGFEQPVLAISPPQDPRLFVLDQPGRIWVVDREQVHEFLDIRDVVRFGGEQGLLGLAFHPGYAENGLFYVDFTDDRSGTVLSEFAVDPNDPNRALVGTRRDVLRIAQPAGNHNGGMIAFGADGLLWLGLGDGGGANDRYRNGQRSDRRLGSMIRVAVGPGAPEPYGEPVDGPFVEAGGLPEVWSIGLRNPWRWAFDGDDLYIADVGQNEIEEINVVSAGEGGLNFGWPVLEGDECFRSAECDRSGMQPPAVTYTHSDGCSVTGGFVYRGTALPELDGHYFFGDYCSGWVDSIVLGPGGEVEMRRRWFDAGTVTGLTSFGIDATGEIYAMTTGGMVYRIVRS